MYVVDQYMYVLCCDLFFSRIYRNVSDRNSFLQKRLFIAYLDTSLPRCPQRVFAFYIFIFRFYTSKFRLMKSTENCRKHFPCKLKCFLLLSVHITCMYIYTCTLVKWKYYKNWGENTNLPTTYGICSTVTRVFRRAGFFQKSRGIHYFYVSYQIRTHNHSQLML